MSTNPNNKYFEFSEFEIEQFYIKFKDDEKHEETGAVGSMEEAMEAKTVKKNYKGKMAKTRTRGTGSGTLKLVLHMSYEKYNKMFGKESEGLADGVTSYGEESLHETFSVTALVRDEDGYEKFKAYPNCTVANAPAGKIENGAEEVAEIELELAVMPDKYGQGMYEALKGEVSEEIAGQWMESFTPEIVRVTEA